MNKISILLMTIIGLIFTECIPTKDLIYLQSKNKSDVNQPINVINTLPYRLQTNDIISIGIKTLDPKLDLLFRTSNSSAQSMSEQGLYFDGFTIDDHGNIRVPLLGEVSVIGLTIDEIRIKIEQKLLSDYFNKESNLFVNVKLAGFRYTTNGEINVTGTKVLYQEKINILEAIANCGDIPVTGDRKNVQIIRRNPQGTEIHTVDLTDVNVMNSPYYNLQPNDYIYVKPLKQKTWGTGKTGLESLGSIITIISLATTTYLLLKK
ncbi:MAG: polysaccharide biosynthesis/export family protein [Flavobacterium sp.]|nr:polysaccharide biosynthesis/export family protein [Flavobacterium sp.]